MAFEYNMKTAWPVSNVTQLGIVIDSLHKMPRAIGSTPTSKHQISVVSFLDWNLFPVSTNQMVNHSTFTALTTCHHKT